MRATLYKRSPFSFSFRFVPLHSLRFHSIPFFSSPLNTFQSANFGDY
jgi:hypothetical protein